MRRMVFAGGGLAFTGALGLSNAVMTKISNVLSKEGEYGKESSLVPVERGGFLAKTKQDESLSNLFSKEGEHDQESSLVQVERGDFSSNSKKEGSSTATDFQSAFEELNKKFQNFEESNAKVVNDMEDRHADEVEKLQEAHEALDLS